MGRMASPLQPIPRSIVGLVPAIALALGCGGPAVPYQAFAVEGTWVGSAQVDTTRIDVALVADLSLCSAVLILTHGTITDTINVDLDYEPPVLAVQPCLPAVRFASFVGELHQFNLVQGHLYAEGLTVKTQMNLQLLEAQGQ